MFCFVCLLSHNAHGQGTAPQEAAQIPHPQVSLELGVGVGVEQLWLLTEAEAEAIVSEAVVADQEGSAPLPKGITPPALGFNVLSARGPSITTVQPESFQVTAPFSLEVSFEEHSGRGVVLSSLRVKAQKWYLGKFRGNRDITERVLPFTTRAGIVLPSLVIPRGTYRIETSIDDLSGATTTAELRLGVGIKPKAN